MLFGIHEYVLHSARKPRLQGFPGVHLAYLVSGVIYLNHFGVCLIATHIAMTVKVYHLDVRQS